MRLNDLGLGDICIVKKIENNDTIKRRLLDLGLTPGTKVEVVLENFGKNLKAYMIRNVLIAIRNNDSRNVLVDVI